MRALNGILSGCFFLFLALAAFSSAWADAVEDALIDAKNSLRNTMNDNANPAGASTLSQSSANSADLHDAAGSARDSQQDMSHSSASGAVDPADGNTPEQAVYPGVANCSIRQGGAGKPSVFVYYPAFGNEKIDAIFKDFALAQSNSFEKDVRESAPEDGETPESYGSWELTGFYTLEKPNPNVVSVAFNIYSYTGGAHGDLQVDVLNYFLDSARKIGLEDIFAEPARAIGLMSDISIAKLRRSLGEDVEEEMLAEGAAPTEANFSNLSLLPGGIAVEFQPYQVGPWSIGQQHVEISLEELASAGPSSKIWPNFHPQSSR